MAVICTNGWAMLKQFRLYTIKQNHLQQFVKEWKKTVLPLRLKHGFEIDRAWTMERSNQFAWVISYEGVKSWDVKEKGYYASTERSKLMPDPARLIARAEQYFLEDVL